MDALELLLAWALFMALICLVIWRLDLVLDVHKKSPTQEPE